MTNPLTLTRLPIVMAAVAVVALAGCTSPSDSSGDTVDSAMNQVLMQNARFSPDEMTIQAGETVTWTNKDSMGHTVTPVNPEMWGTMGSGDASADWMMKGDSWSHTFMEPGDYEYYCKPHATMMGGGQFQGMTGVIHVEA